MADDAALSVPTVPSHRRGHAPPSPPAPPPQRISHLLRITGLVDSRGGIPAGNPGVRAQKVSYSALCFPALKVHSWGRTEDKEMEGRGKSPGIFACQHSGCLCLRALFLRLVGAASRIRLRFLEDGDCGIYCCVPCTRHVDKQWRL